MSDREFNTQIRSNPGLFRAVHLVGLPGSGKTECLRALAYYAKVKYGGDITVVYSRKELEPLLVGIGDAKDGQVWLIIAEDISLAKEKRETLQRLFDVRGEIRDRHGPKKRLVILLFSSHRYWSAPKELRDITHAIILRSTPKNLWDLGRLPTLFHVDTIQELMRIEYEREDDLELWPKCALAWGARQGVIELAEVPVRQTVKAEAIQKSGGHIISR